MPSQKTSSFRAPASNDMLVRGVTLLLIGLIMLIAPHFMGATPLRDMLASAQIVAWFATVLGAAFMAQYGLRQRKAAKAAEQAAAEDTPKPRRRR